MHQDDVQAFALGVTRFGQPILRLLHLVRVVVHHHPAANRHVVRHVAEDTRRREAVRRQLVTLQHVVDQALAVDRRGKRLAHGHIIKRRLAVDETVVVGAQARGDEQLLAQLRVSLDAVHVRQRRSPTGIGSHVNLVGLVHRHLGRGFHDDGTLDDLDLNRIRIHPQRVLHQPHIGAVGPLLQGVGTVGDDQTRFGPVVAIGLDGGLGHGEGDPHTRDGGEVARRLFQRELHRGVVQRLDPDGVPQLAEVLGVRAGRVVLLRALDDVQHVGVIRSGGRVQGALDAVLDVHSGYRAQILKLARGGVAMDPMHVVAYLVGPGQPVFRCRPLGRQRGDHVGLLVEAGQPHKHLADHPDRGGISGQARVEAGRLGAYVGVQGDFRLSRGRRWGHLDQLLDLDRLLDHDGLDHLLALFRNHHRLDDGLRRCWGTTLSRNH